MILIKNGLVHNAIDPQPFKADILVGNGKIVKIDKDIPEGENVDLVDAEGMHIYPGFVEAHGHIGLDGYGIGYEGMDYNEMNDIACHRCVVLTVSKLWTLLSARLLKAV